MCVLAHKKQIIQITAVCPPRSFYVEYGPQLGPTRGGKGLLVAEVRPKKVRACRLFGFSVFGSSVFFVFVALCTFLTHSSLCVFLIYYYYNDDCGNDDCGNNDCGNNGDGDDCVTTTVATTTAMMAMTAMATTMATTTTVATTTV